MRRTITVTEVEMRAVAAAAALHEAEYEVDPTPETRGVDRALTRVIAKWHAAGRTRRYQPN